MRNKVNANQRKRKTYSELRGVNPLLRPFHDRI